MRKYRVTTAQRRLLRILEVRGWGFPVSCTELRRVYHFNIRTIASAEDHGLIRWQCATYLTEAGYVLGGRTG